MPAAKKKAAGKPRARRSQQQRSEATTRKIVAAARKRFRRDGFQGTSLEAIVADCGVTKGAFYHHFKNKEDVFEAVFVVEHEELFAEILDAYMKRRGTIKARALAGFRAFIRGSLAPGVQQVTLLDAPSILGWERMREIEGRYGLDLLRSGIAEAMEAGEMKRRDPDALAHLLQGAMTECAMYIARSDDQASATRRVERELKLLLDGLFVS